MDIDEARLVVELRKDNLQYILNAFPGTLYKKYIFGKLKEGSDPLLINNPPMISVAAYCGATNCISKILETDVDLKMRDRNKMSLADFAAAGGFLPVVQLLFEKVSFEESIGLAALYKHFEVCKYLVVEKKLSVNVIDQEGRTPFHNAAIGGSIQILKLFIENGAEADAADRNGNTALLLAAMHNNFEVVKYLLTVDSIRPNPINERKETLFHFAATQKSAEVISYIMGVCGKAGILDVKRWDFMTTDFLALENDFDLEDIILPGYEGQSVSIDTKTIDGETPLMYAAKSAAFQPFMYLLSMGANPMERNERLQTVLLMAVESNCPEIISIILKIKGFDINAQDNAGQNCLHYAVKSNRPDIVSLLLSQSTLAMNAYDSDHIAPLHIVAKNGSIIIGKMLLGVTLCNPNVETSEKATPLFVAAKAGNLEMLRLLLSQISVDPNCKDIHGSTPLHAAARFNQVEITAELLKRKDINPNSEDDEGWTPLHYASRNAHGDIVRLLCRSKGIELNIKDKKGKTPLHFAMNQDIREYMISKGAE